LVDLLINWIELFNQSLYIILIKIDYDIVPFLAVDCGIKIKDLDDIKRLDLYFVNDLQSAYKWGMKELDIKVINPGVSK